MNPLRVRAGGLSALLASTAPSHFGMVLSRSYRAATEAAAAALPQLDYDSDYHECGEDEDMPSDRGIPTPALDDQGGIPVKGVHWVFIGEPSAKKHVYAEMISKILEVPHISITSLVRQEISPRSFLCKEIANAVNHGKHVHESIILRLLSQRLEYGYYRGETGFILDGLPRTRLQAEILDQVLDIDLVVNFKCFKGCSCGGREPSSEEAETNISAFYKQQIDMLVEYYRNQKKLIDFQVGSAPAETWKGLLAVLHLQHANAARHRLQETLRGSSSLKFSGCDTCFCTKKSNKLKS